MDATTPSLAPLREAARRAEGETAAALAARDERDRLALGFYEGGGVTYHDLAGALGLTRDRVSQVLAEQRRKRQNATTA